MSTSIVKFIVPIIVNGSHYQLGLILLTKHMQVASCSFVTIPTIAQDVLYSIVGESVVLNTQQRGMNKPT